MALALVLAAGADAQQCAAQKRKVREMKKEIKAMEVLPIDRKAMSGLEDKMLRAIDALTDEVIALRTGELVGRRLLGTPSAPL